jgi:galactokinase
MASTSLHKHELRRTSSLVTEKFTEKFKAAPELWSRAPGRVDLMGSHTDYNLGNVMTMTIDRDTWIAARPRDDRKVAIYSLNVDGGGKFDLDQIEPDARTPWTNYVRGVAKFLQAAGHSWPGSTAWCTAPSPQQRCQFVGGDGNGRGVMFQLVSGFRIDPVRLALIGQQAENKFVGVNCAFSINTPAMGEACCALLLDCRQLTSRSVPVAEGLQVVICDTHAKRTLAGTEYGERRAQCEQGVRLVQKWYPGVAALRDVTLAQFNAHERDLPHQVSKRCRFIIEENQRVLDLAETLTAGDTTCLQQLFAASYAGARDLYEIGAPAMEAMMHAMLGGPGVVAARQAGAGFGGCMVALVRQTQVDAFTDHVAHAYAAKMKIEPSVYPVQAAPGAGPL